MKSSKLLLIILLVVLPAFSLFSLPDPIVVCDYQVEIIDHNWFMIGYDEEYEQPRWAAYELTAEELEGTAARSDSFRADPLVSTGSAALSDYRGSGYDRGHLVPAADLKFSAEAMKESFFLSNVSPQTPSFNRGKWLELESAVRCWARDNGAVYIITGPLFTDDNPVRIGKNGVAVPQYFFKAVLDYTEPELKAVGFILPNSKCSLPLPDYSVAVNLIEEASGMDFFAFLPDDIEEQLESAVNPDLWPARRFER